MKVLLEFLGHRLQHESVDGEKINFFANYSNFEFLPRKVFAFLGRAEPSEWLNQCLGWRKMFYNFQTNQAWICT